MKAATGSRWDNDVRFVVWLAACVSLFSFLYYFRVGEFLLYGDAVAHINIARRVIDSMTPGLLQLGTVWLPLPHLLQIPFVIPKQMWQSGVGGSIPSMFAYVFGVIGVFRLVRGTLARTGASDTSARIPAWAATLGYGANPNLIYMQSTAMGEVVYLCFFVWALVHFSEFVGGERNSLGKCGLSVLAASLTRYDGWLLGALLTIAVVMLHFFPQTRNSAVIENGPDAGALQVPRNAVLKFVLISAAGPLIWLAYNGAIYGNPLEFATGPYSAKAIEQKSKTVNPAKGNLFAAGAYFLKSAELNVAENQTAGRTLLALAAAGAAVILIGSRSAWPLMLLWMPLPFYALSIAFAAVPIFVPLWWPFSQYNVRYGLELLPVFSVSLGALIYFGLKLLRTGKVFGTIVRLAVMVILVVGYISVWQAVPICLREAQTNSRGRIALEQQVATWLKKLPPDSTILMYLGDHPGAVERAGIPLKRVINEGNHRVWKRPVDPEGLWERALAAPQSFADYVLAFEGDQVWNAVQSRGLKELVEIEVTGQPRAVLFRAR